MANTVYFLNIALNLRQHFQIKTLLQTITGKAEKISDDGFITDKV